MRAGDAPSASVLLVDDQPSDLMALERQLSGSGLRVVKATSGEEALQHLDVQDFALILMDVRMPGLDGFETARLIRQQQPQRRVPLIFLSGAPREEAMVVSGYANGAVDYLRKPVDPEALRAKVRVFVHLYLEREALRREQAALHEHERRELEARRLAVEKDRERLLEELREAVRLRDEFLSVASHELKTPLTPLALRLRLLLKEVEAEPESPSTRRMLRHLETARQQVRRLTLLVDSLLDTTRITGGRIPLCQQEGVDLAVIVRDVAASFETQAVRAGCPMGLEVPGQVLGRWDPLRLEQVVSNLLSNALKFGAGSPVLLRVEARDGWGRLVVRDQGIGMNDDVRARLFRRFERGVSERHYGGLGLGLFISQQIVQAMGGHILVESTPGQGATFTVELPCSFLPEPPSPGEGPS
ncbi:hybrid sensor histidine kinase/response regulator [Archangium lipolyticum]|uniref:hybrid sensor histidine kinase/response regulator n=1 Tax=Archangium lipolyticum TaxID=2970465 RepID=UPI00214A391B|nr:hybrid sensor histidine kinase/response regulator [Archangium lipolyticum]